MYNELDRGYNSFVTIARKLGIMDNIKANVPRTAYKGIVSVWIHGIKIHVVPKKM